MPQSDAASTVKTPDTAQKVNAALAANVTPAVDLSIDLSIVIVSYNTRDMLRECLLAVDPATPGLAVEVWVVDNNSTDGSAQMVEGEFPATRLIANSDNPGFARANNQAIAQCSGRNILLLNPDTEAAPHSLTTLAQYLDANPDVGAVGPKLLNTDGSLQHNGRHFPNPWREFVGHSGLRWLAGREGFGKFLYGRDDFDVEWSTDLVSGACIMVPGRVIDRVGMLDGDFFMFYEEIEWCWRIRKAGYKVMYLPQSRVTHHWMGSVRKQPRAMSARLHKSALVYYGKTAGLGTRAAMLGIVGMALAKNEVLHLGVAVKRQLRAHKLVR